MDVFVNTVTRTLQKSVSNSQPPTSLAFKRGDTAALNVIFVTALTQVELATDTVISFGVKARGDYDGDLLVYTASFTKTGTGESTVYTANPSFATAELDATLFKDATTGNDLASIIAMGEITWTDGGDDSVTSTETLSILIHNDVIRDEELSPTALPVPIGTTAPVSAAVAATNTLTFSGVGVAGQIVNIFGHIYTAVATAPAADEFTIGGSANGSLANLTFAINMSGGNPGTTHGSGGVANAYVSAVYNGDGTISLTALVAGSAGNEITTTTDVTGGSFNDPTLEGGVDATLAPPYLRAEGSIGYLYTSAGWMEFQLETLGTL